MTGAVRVTERASRVAPFGARFWDVASRRPVADGLRVLHRDPAGRVTAAVPSRSGVWALHRVPGLREVEAGAGDEDYWDAPPPRRAGTIEVSDRLGRFVPVSFVAELPTRGILTRPCAAGTPGADRPGAPLFPSPSRRLPSGLAAIHAELEDRDSGQPAAFAVLEAEVQVGAAPAVRARGVADRNGRVLVALPYPEPPTAAGAGEATPLAAQTWTAGLRLFYRHPDPGERDDDLCRILNQAEGRLLGTSQPPAPVTETTIAFGRASVARSDGDPTLRAAAEPPP